MGRRQAADRSKMGKSLPRATKVSNCRWGNDAAQLANVETAQQEWQDSRADRYFEVLNELMGMTPTEIANSGLPYFLGISQTPADGMIAIDQSPYGVRGMSAD